MTSNYWPRSATEKRPSSTLLDLVGRLCMTLPARYRAWHHACTGFSASMKVWLIWQTLWHHRLGLGPAGRVNGDPVASIQRDSGTSKNKCEPNWFPLTVKHHSTIIYKRHSSPVATIHMMCLLLWWPMLWQYHPLGSEVFTPNKAMFFWMMHCSSNSSLAM